MQEQASSTFTFQHEVKSRAQPHNLEAEQGLLGAMLLDNEVHFQVADFLNEKHFFDPVHQRIFATMAKLIAGGNLATPVVLKTYMENDAGLQELGGTVYLAQLASNATTLSNAKEYGRVIYDLALRRELIHLGQEIVDDAYDAVIEENPHEQIEKAEQVLYGLAERGPASAGFMGFDQSLSGALGMARRAYENEGRLSGLDTGFTELNKRLGGFQPSDLIILAGRPSMGKTALATNIAFNVAQDYMKARRDGYLRENADGSQRPAAGGMVGFFSLEMSAEQIAMRLIVERADVNASNIRTGQIDDDEYERLCNAVTEMEEIPLYIDHTGAIPMATLAARARRLKRQYGLDLLVVDYLQLVRTSSGRFDGRVQEVSEITQGLKALAKELDIPILALSQLSRQVENRDDKRPQLADLRESGAIEQDADVVMFVFRESYYLLREKPEEGTDKFLDWQEKMSEKDGQAEIIVGKNRHGPVSTIDVQFNAAHTRFSNLIADDHVPERRSPVQRDEEDYVSDEGNDLE